MSNQNKITKIESYRAMIAGVQTNVGTTTSIAIRYVAMAQPVIVSTPQGFIDAADATAAALAAYRGAVAKQKLAAASANGVYLSVKEYALAQYGNLPATLGTFGPGADAQDAGCSHHGCSRRQARGDAGGEGEGPRDNPGGGSGAGGEQRAHDPQVVSA
jgi:hypothetical protein